MSDLYDQIYLRDLGGYVVFRHFKDIPYSVDMIAKVHRVATFVTEKEAKDYCHYRNELVAKLGTDELP